MPKQVRGMIMNYLSRKLHVWGLKFASSVLNLELHLFELTQQRNLSLSQYNKCDKCMYSMNEWLHIGYSTIISSSYIIDF